MSTRAEQDAYIDIKTLAAWLCIKPATAYRMAESGQIPSYKFGKLRRFNVKEVKAWAENCRDGK